MKLGEKVDFRKLRIFYMDSIKSSYISPTDPDLLQCLNKVVRYFETNYEVLAYKLDLPLFHWLLEIWMNDMTLDQNVPSMSQEMLNRKGDFNPHSELTNWFLGRSHHTFPAIGLAVIESFTKQFNGPEVKKKMILNREKLQRQLFTLLENNSIFLFPPHPTVAPFHHQPLLQPMNFINTALFNSLGMPVTQCPMGLNSDGIPLGIQVAATPFNDHLCLAIARELESNFGGWIDPALVNVVRS